METPAVRTIDSTEAAEIANRLPAITSTAHGLDLSGPGGIWHGHCDLDAQGTGCKTRKRKEMAPDRGPDRNLESIRLAGRATEVEHPETRLHLKLSSCRSKKNEYARSMKREGW